MAGRKKVVVVIVEQVDCGAVASFRRLHFEAVFRELFADFDQRLLAETADARKVGFGSRCQRSQGEQAGSANEHTANELKMAATS